MLEPPPRELGVAPAVGADIPDLPYVRLTQRDEPPRDHRRLYWVLALVLAGHALVVWLVWNTPRRLARPGHAIAVTLIEPESALPPPPPLVMPPPLQGQPAPAPRPAPPPRRQVPRAPGSMAATLENAQGHPLDLYGANGQIRLPTATAPQPAPAYSAPELQGAPILTIKTPLKYKPTRFNKDWAPLNQTLGGKTVGRAFDKLVEKTTVAKTVHLPGGLKVKCGISPLLLAFGCMPPPPPSAPPDRLENDIRLSMPPPETLTGKKVPLPSSASSTQPPASGKP